MSGGEGSCWPGPGRGRGVGPRQGRKMASSGGWRRLAGLTGHGGGAAALREVTWARRGLGWRLLEGRQGRGVGQGAGRWPGWARGQDTGGQLRTGQLGQLGGCSASLGHSTRGRCRCRPAGHGGAGEAVQGGEHLAELIHHLSRGIPPPNTPLVGTYAPNPTSYLGYQSSHPPPRLGGSLLRPPFYNVKALPQEQCWACLPQAWYAHPAAAPQGSWHTHRGVAAAAPQRAHSACRQPRGSQC